MIKNAIRINSCVECKKEKNRMKKVNKRKEEVQHEEPLASLIIAV